MRICGQYWVHAFSRSIMLVSLISKRNLTQENGLVAKIERHRITLPMWVAVVWVFPFLDLDAAFCV